MVTSNTTPLILTHSLPRPHRNTGIMISQQRISASSLLLLFTTCLSLVTAQQNLLTSGNSQLPACAQTCQLLNQAAGACEGDGANAWNCFCQSGYLKPLYTSPTGICDSYCTDATDNQNVMNWYKAQCGTDNGATEHTGAAAAAPSATPSTTTTSSPSTSTTVAPVATPSKSTGSTTNNGAANSGSTSDSDDDGKPWINTHYQWIIFIVVVIVGFALITVAAVWYKRRYYRKRDQMSGAFNAGVSEPPPMSNTEGANHRESGRFA